MYGQSLALLYGTIKGMQTHINPIRAIGAEFLRRKFSFFVLLFIAINTVLVLILAFLIIQISAWWWLLALAWFLAFGIVSAVFVTAYLVIQTINPRLSKPQKVAVRSFVDKFERVAEQIGTPWIIIGFRIARDVIWPGRRQTYIQSVAKDGTSLHKDYLELTKAF